MRCAGVDAVVPVTALLDSERLLCCVIETSNRSCTPDETQELEGTCPSAGASKARVTDNLRFNMPARSHEGGVKMKVCGNNSSVDF